MNLQELKEANLKRCKQSFKMELNDWSIAEWSNAVCGEAGELANICKKVRRGDFFTEEAKEAIAEEVGGVIVYLDLLCQSVGLDMHDCIKNEFNRVSEKRGSDIKV